MKFFKAAGFKNSPTYTVMPKTTGLQPNGTSSLPAMGRMRATVLGDVSSALPPELVCSGP